MNLNNWLHYLESFPSEPHNKSLEHVKTVAKRLSILDVNPKVITVAGTNGKGSTVIFLESILLAAGFKTGAYISPHILNYNERIRLNGKNIDDETLCQAFALIEKTRANIVLSYFEFSTLAALTIFKKKNLDVLILEAGLGGRFDAVNILDNDLSIITTISFDHTHILGYTKDAIGYEKAGIMRPFKLVVCGKNMPKSIFTAANNLQTNPYYLNKDFFYIKKNSSWDWFFGEITLKNLPLPKLPIESAALTLMAIKILTKDFKISTQTIITGLKNSFLIGRGQELIFAGKKIILDIAHNFEAANLLALNLANKKSDGHILAVVSMLKDKDIVATLTPLAKLVDKWYVGILTRDRAASGLQLTQSLQKVGISNFVLTPEITTSFKQAIAECQKKDKIVVFGSSYTVTEILKFIDITLEDKK